MKVIIDPQWGFAEALNAAWKAYKTDGVEARTNRKRVLEKWANVVGRYRAITELEKFLSASSDSTLTPYIVEKLKRQFRLMPEVTHFSRDLDSITPPLRLPQENDIDTVLNQFIQLAQKSEIDPISKLTSILLRDSSKSSIDEKNLQQLLEIIQIAGVDVTVRAINWMVATAGTKNIVSTLEKLDFDELKKLNAAVGLGSLKHVLEIWRNNEDNENEEFWQNVLTQNSFLFTYLSYLPVIILDDKAYVGGKSISNKGGNIVDFLCASSLTRNAILVEIKNPKTKLLGSKYRGDIYNISTELSGSVIQVSNYKNSLMKNYATIVNPEEEGFEAFDPRCVVIAGNIYSELTDYKKRKSLELFRMGLKDIQIITYDELFGKVEFLVKLLEGTINE
jgi:hypothetical protein